MTGKEFVAWIEDRGWVRDRMAKGSHIVYRFPANNAFYVVLGNIFKDTGRKSKNMMSNVKRLERQGIPDNPPTKNSCRPSQNAVAC